MRKLSKELINHQLESSGRTVRLVGDYYYALSKSLYKCLECGHQWMAVVNSIRNGKGCPECADTRLSKELINHQLESSGRTVRLVGDYSGALKKSIFSCLVCDHQWMASPSNIRDGRGCPSCAPTGYNPGKPAWFYILKFDGFIKYGITNNFKKRLSSHKRNGTYSTVFEKLYEDGSIPQNLERKVKQILGGKYVTPEQFPDGWTETLCLTKLNDVLIIIQS